jgi:hypothetical protein
MKAQEVHELQKFKELTDKFSGQFFDWASTLEMQYLLPHIHDLQRAIQEKLKNGN